MGHVYFNGTKPYQLPMGGYIAGRDTAVGELPDLPGKPPPAEDISSAIKEGIAKRQSEVVIWDHGAKAKLEDVARQLRYRGFDAQYKVLQWDEDERKGALVVRLK